MVGTLTDISQRKNAELELRFSEARYRRLFETAQDGILILDAETGKIADVNPYLTDMLGYSKAQLTERHIWELGFPDDMAANREIFRELREKEYVRYEDLPLESSIGKVLDVEFVSNVYRVEDYKVIQCNIRDITDRKRSEDTIKKLLAEKDLILREVHHRIKNNMSTISSL